MAMKIGSAIKTAPVVRKQTVQQQPAPANQYRKYFYSVDPDTGAEVLDEDFREYFYKQTGGRINPDNLDDLYLSYAQEKTNAQRDESGLDKIKYPKWYDPTGKVEDTRQFYNYMKAYDALPQSGDYSSLDYLRKLYDQDKQSIEEHVQYQDTLATEKAKAKALGLSYTEGMALPTWNAESPLAKYYAYTDSEEDKQRQQYGLPPVSYTNEFKGTEGKAAMLAGELPVSVRYTQNLYDEYAALVDEVNAMAEAGTLNEWTLADAFIKYAALDDLRKYYADRDVYETTQAGKTESQKRLEAITGTGEKPPKALFNEGMLADLGLGATFYDDLLAQGTAYQAQTQAQRTAEKRGKQLAFWANALQKGIGMAVIDAARGTTPGVAQAYERDTGDGRDDTVYIGAGEPPRSEVQESIWLQIPDFSKDIDLLMKDVEAIRQSDPDRLGSTIQRGWKSGQLAYLYNIEMAKEMLGQENRAEEIKALLDDPVFQTEPKNLFLDIVESSVEQTPRYWEALRNLIMPESPGTLPEIDPSFTGTLKETAGTLGDLTMLPALYWEMAGGAYAGQIQAGVAEEVAAVHAPIQGMVDTFIEVAQLDLIFGGAKKLGGVALKKISNKAIARIAKALGGAFTGYGSELGEELAQEINAIVWEELGKGITGQMTGEAVMPTNFDEVTGRLSGTLVEASKALVPTIFGGFVNSAFDTAAAPIKWDAAVAPESVSGTVDAARIASENVAPILDQIAESGGDVTKVEALVTDTQTIAAQEPVQAPQTAMGAQGIITPEEHSDAPTGRVDALRPVDNRTANVSRETRATKKVEGAVEVSPVKHPAPRMSDAEIRKLGLGIIRDTGLNERTKIAREYIDAFVAAYQEGDMEALDDFFADNAAELSMSGQAEPLASPEEYAVYEYATHGMKDLRVDPRKIGDDSRELSSARQVLRGVTKFSTSGSARGIDTISPEVFEVTGVWLGEKEDEIADNLADIIERVRKDKERLAGREKGKYVDDRVIETVRRRTRGLVRAIATGKTIKADIADIDRESLKKLANALSGDPANTVRVTVTAIAPQSNEQMFIQRFASSLGYDVIYYKNTGKVQKNEFFDPENPSAIFVNVNGPAKNIEWAFGHGLYHALDMRGLMDDVVKTTYGEEWYESYKKSLSGGLDEKNLRRAEEYREKFADELGNAMTDPVFWGRLRSENNSLFNAVRDIVYRLLKKAKKFIGRVTGLDAARIERFRVAVADTLNAISEASAEMSDLYSEIGLLFSDWEGLQTKIEEVAESLDADIALSKKETKYGEAWEYLEEVARRKKEARAKYDDILKTMRSSGIEKKIRERVKRLIDYRIEGAKAAREALTAKHKEELRDVKRDARDKVREQQQKHKEELRDVKQDARDKAKEQRQKHKEELRDVKQDARDKAKEQRQKQIDEIKKLKDTMRGQMEALRDKFEERLIADRELLKERFRLKTLRKALRTEKTRIKNMGEAIVKTLASGRYKGKPLSSSTKAILKSFADNTMPTLRNRAYAGKLDFGDLAALLSGDTVELRDAKGNATMVPAPDTEMPLAVIAGLQGRDVSTLDADDLKHLRRLVKWLASYPEREHTLFVRGKHYELAVAQHEAIAQLQAEHKEPFKEGGVSAIGRKLFMDWFAMTKSRVARRILGVEDGTAQYILNEAFSEAEKKYQANLSSVYELTDEMENRLKKDQTLFGKNDADFIAVETEIEVNGKAKTEKVTLKRGEAVFVALNSYNDKNRQSLRNGGTLWNDTAIPSLTDAAINDVRDSVINDASLRWWVASIMNAYKQSGEWYNAGSMDAHGWEVAQEDNYYPIERDKAGFITRSEMMSGTLDSIPRLIPRVKSSNKPYNASHPVWFLFQNMEIAARYNAYILPIRNLKYFMFTPTFRNEVQARLGDDPVKWYQDFVRNIESRQIFAQNATKKAMKVVRVVRQNKTLAVLVSVKSWVKQFSSWFLLARHIDPDILVRSGVTILSKNDREMMKKHAPFLHNRLRTGGNIEAYESANLALRGMGRVLRPFRNLGVNANQRIDAFVVGRTWAAAKAQVRRSHKDISVNSDAYWEAVSELSSKIAEECLTNYSPTLRSMFGNNSDEFLRMLTMFSTDRNQLRNLLEDARWDIAHGKKARGARTLTGVLCSTMFLIAVDALLSRWRYRKKEDEEAGFLEKILFGGEGPKWFDVFSSVADQIMSTSYMGSIFDVFSKGYEPRHMSVSAITDLAIDMAGLLDHWVDEDDETVFDRMIPGEESLEYGRRVLESASQLLGFNVNFLERDFIVPILMRADWTKYDAYARITKMGLGAADFYPYVQSAVDDNNKEDLRQLAEVIAKYVVDKQKVNDSAATYPYRSTNWYREEKMKHETTGAPNKYAAFDGMYYSAYKRFGGRK